jgi:hypothetical protein
VQFVPEPTGPPVRRVLDAARCAIVQRVVVVQDEPGDLLAVAAVPGGRGEHVRVPRQIDLQRGNQQQHLRGGGGGGGKLQETTVILRASLQEFLVTGVVVRGDLPEKSGLPPTRSCQIEATQQRQKTAVFFAVRRLIVLLVFLGQRRFRLTVLQKEEGFVRMELLPQLSRGQRIRVVDAAVFRLVAKGSGGIEDVASVEGLLAVTHVVKRCQTVTVPQPGNVGGRNQRFRRRRGRSAPADEGQPQVAVAPQRFRRDGTQRDARRVQTSQKPQVLSGQFHEIAHRE